MCQSIDLSAAPTVRICEFVSCANAFHLVQYWDPRRPGSDLNSCSLHYVHPYNFCFLPSSAQPAHRWRSSNSGDLDKIYDAVTPNPTGSLSGPWFDMTPDEGDLTGIAAKVTHLVCRIKNLGNNTASPKYSVIT